MENIIEEIEKEEVPKDKEFYISVNYFDGVIPFAYISENLDDFTKKKDKVYKIKIPVKSKLG